MDKKGILSWPNPTAEKVFFLRNGSWGHQQTDFGKEGATLKPTPTVAGPILKKDKEGNKRMRKRSNKRGYAERNDFGVQKFLKLSTVYEFNRYAERLRD